MSEMNIPSRKPKLYWRIFYRNGEYVDAEADNIPMLCVKHMDLFINKAVINIVFHKAEFEAATPSAPTETPTDTTTQE